LPTRKLIQKPEAKGQWGKKKKKLRKPRGKKASEW